MLDRLGRPVHASKLFHSGEHPTLRLRTREGYELTGTHNHPVLCLVDMVGVPLLLWKRLDEIAAGDRVLLARMDRDDEDWIAGRDGRRRFFSARSCPRAGSVANRGGFNNVDRDYFDAVLDAYDAVVGGNRYVYTRTIQSGSAAVTSSMSTTSSG